MLPIATGPRVPDAGGLQVREGIQEALLLEVEGVVVCQRAGVHAARPQDLDGRRVGTEVEDFGGARPRPLMFGYGALQVDDAQVSGEEQRQRVAPRFLGAYAVKS